MPAVVVQLSDTGFDYLLAKPVGQQWALEHCGSVSREIADNDAADSSSSNLGPSSWSWVLSDGLASLRAESIRLAGRRLVLCVNRPEVEFCALRLPKIEGVEFSEAVQNQLSIDEKIEPTAFSIDFAFIPADDDQLTYVAWLDVDEIGRWNQAASQQQLRLENISVRPLATIELISTLSQQQLQGTCLLIAAYGRQADLILLHDRKPHFIRSLNLQHPEVADEVAKQLMSEIRLSIGTYDLDDLDETLTNAIVIANQAIATQTIIQLKLDLDIDAVRMDPFEMEAFDFRDFWQQDQDPASKEPHPEGNNCITPMLGTLLLHVQSPTAAVLDLLNPKTPVQPASMLRRIALVTAVILFAVGYFGYSKYHQYSVNYTSMTKIVSDAKKKKELLDRTAPKAAVVDFVQQWEKQRVHWLQQLQSLTEKLPSGDQAVIRQFNGTKTAAGASISMQIHVRDLQVVQQIDDTIRDSELKLQIRRLFETQDRDFPIRLETVLLAPGGVAEALTEASTEAKAKSAAPQSDSAQTPTLKTSASPKEKLPAPSKP